MSGTVLPTASRAATRLSAAARASTGPTRPAPMRMGLSTPSITTNQRSQVRGAEVESANGQLMHVQGQPRHHVGVPNKQRTAGPLFAHGRRHQPLELHDVAGQLGAQDAMLFPQAVSLPQEVAGVVVERGDAPAPVQVDDAQAGAFRRRRAEPPRPLALATACRMRTKWLTCGERRRIMRVWVACQSPFTGSSMTQAELALCRLRRRRRRPTLCCRLAAGRIRCAPGLS